MIIDQNFVMILSFMFIAQVITLLIVWSSSVAIFWIYFLSIHFNTCVIYKVSLFLLEWLRLGRQSLDISGMVCSCLGLWRYSCSILFLFGPPRYSWKNIISQHVIVILSMHIDYCGAWCIAYEMISPQMLFWEFEIYLSYIYLT